ncbi:hypothetical protein D3C85_149270 [compost metagenome]|jgi:hypothetical protein
MRLLKLSVVETNGAMQGMIRPFDTDIKQSDIDRVVNLTDDGRSVSAERIARAISSADGMIIPSVEFKFESKIDNGWGERRLMFAMVVEVQTTRTSSHYEYIVGYTDHADYSQLSGRAKFDPDMKMYFNSITRVHMTAATYRGGSQIWEPSIKAHDQILNRSAINGERRRTDLTPVTLRPTDLFNRKGSESAFGSHLRASGSIGTNTTGSFSSQLRASNRENNDPSRFLSRALTAHSRATANRGMGDADRDDDDMVMTSAADLAVENSLDVDPYLEELRRVSGIMDSGYITFGELMEMNPEFDEDKQLPFTPYEMRKSSIDLSGASKWSSDEPETLAATIIAQSLPVVMINAMYSKVDNLILNTRARMGEPKVLAGRCTPFVPGLEATSTLEYFESTVETVILEAISHGGMMDIDCTINANIDQDIEIWISLDGGPEHYYPFFSAADSLTAPTLSNTIETVDLLSDEIVKLAEGVRRVRDDRQPSHVSANRGISLSSDVSDARDERDNRGRRNGRPAW